MHITIPSPPLRCSQCGSTNAVKPINRPSIIAQCLDCGHVKLAPLPPTAAAVAAWTTEPPSKNEF